VSESGSKKKVAVVVISYNGAELLRKFIPPILNSEYDDFEVYVIDNASTDDTAELLARDFPTVNVVSIPVNKGFTNGYVEGLAQIDHEYYVLVSSDIEVSSDWITPVIDLMEADKSIAACQPKIKLYDDKDMFEYSGSAGGYVDSLGYPFAAGGCSSLWKKTQVNMMIQERCFGHQADVCLSDLISTIGQEVWIMISMLTWKRLIFVGG